MTNADNENMAGANALNALSAEERAAYEAQVAESQEARNEATELADTAVILGLSVDPVTPPPAMRAAILDAIATTPQLPRDAAPASAGPVTIPNQPAAIAQPAARRAQARWFQRPAITVASAAAAVALVAGGISLVTDLTAPEPLAPPSAAPQADAMQQLTLASDKQQATVEVGDATATLLWSNSLGLSALAMDGASDAPEGHVYQLWYIGDGEVRDAGVMTAGVDDGSWQLLDGTMHAGDAVGVTVEPTGGSATPSGDPIVVIQS